MVQIRQRNFIRSGSASVSGTLTVNNNVWVEQGGPVTCIYQASVQGTLTVVPATSTYTPPSWLTIPTITFTQGYASSRSFAPYFIEGNYGTSTFSASNLPTGVTVNSASKTLEYNGTSPVAESLTVQLTADDGYVDATDLTTMIVYESSGTAGHVFKKGDIPTGKYLTSDDPTKFQVNVKNRWPDGSVKYAIVSWDNLTVPVNGTTVTLRASALDSSAGTAVNISTLQSSGFAGSVVFTVGPSPGISNYTEGQVVTVNLTDLITTTPLRTWLEGPRCSEWHWRTPVGTDSTLAVWLYIRQYASGKIWSRVIVENGVLFATQTGKRYHVQVKFNNPGTNPSQTTRYDSSIDSSLSFPNYATPWWGGTWTVGNTIPHSSRARWSKEFWLDGSTWKVTAQDPNYLMQTKIFPNYPYRTTSFPSSFATEPVPLHLHGLENDQNSGGYKVSWGHLAYWDVLYLCKTQGSADQLGGAKSSITNAGAHGAYSSFGMRDETQTDPKLIHRPLLPSNWPTIWGSSGGTPVLGAITERSPFKTDQGHAPPYAFLAYAITGDFWFLETLQMVTVSNYVSTNYQYRENASYILWKGLNTRQIAWPLRGLAHAVLFTPDSTDTDSWEYKFTTWGKTALANNVHRQIAVFMDGSLTGTNAQYNTPNTLGYIGFSPYLHGNLGYAIGKNSGGSVLPPYDFYWGDAPWQQNYLNSTLSFIENYELLGTTDQTALQRLVRFALQFPVKLLSLTDWPYVWAGIYEIPLFRKNYNGASYDAWIQAPDWSTVFSWYLSAKLDLGVTFADPKPTLQSTGSPLYDSGYYQNSDPGRLANGYACRDLFTWPRSTWGPLQHSISEAKDKGVTGATDAYNRMISMTGVSPANLDASWNTHNARFNETPHWGAVPR